MKKANKLPNTLKKVDRFNFCEEESKTRDQYRKPRTDNFLKINKGFFELKDLQKELDLIEDQSSEEYKKIQEGLKQEIEDA